MTREEAIDVLKHNYPSACFTELCEAVEIAIQALSAQQEPSQVARDIATIIENEHDMRVMLSQPDIIRCRDCKEFRRWIDTDITFCDRTESEVKEDDFCSRAERRTDEQTD